MENDWRSLMEFEFPHVSKDIICILCKKILYDARISACGCRFCAECIEYYLQYENTTCPGESEDCRDVILNLSENVSKDHVMNRNISKIKLKCPVSHCFYNDDLIKVATHLNECSKLAVRCPYFEQGCKYISMIQNDIDEHLVLQKDNHIRTMVSRIKSLNQNVEVLKDNNKSWKTKLRNAEDVIANLENELKEMGKAINSNKQTDKESQSIPTTFLELQKNLKEYEAEINANKQREKELQDLKKEFNVLQNEINDIKATMKNTWVSLVSPFIWICPYKDSVYQHSNQYSLYPGGPLMVLRSYLQGDYWEICVFMVKGDLNRKMPFPVKCIISITISYPSIGTSSVKDDGTKMFSSDTDAYKFTFKKLIPLSNLHSIAINDIIIKCLVKIIE